MGGASAAVRAQCAHCHGRRGVSELYGFYGLFGVFALYGKPGAKAGAFGGACSLASGGSEVFTLAPLDLVGQHWLGRISESRVGARRVFVLSLPWLETSPKGQQQYSHGRAPYQFLSVGH